MFFSHNSSPAPPLASHFFPHHDGGVAAEEGIPSRGERPSSCSNSGYFSTEVGVRKGYTRPPTSACSLSKYTGWPLSVGDKVDDKVGGGVDGGVDGGVNIATG